MSQEKTSNRFIGNFCVVADVDGKVEVKELSEAENIFAEAKPFIGCSFLDHVVVYSLNEETKIEYLVNDNGYADWNKDPAMVNKLATYLYNGGKKPGHYILGNVVFCLSSYDEENGWDFRGMSKDLAVRFAACTTEKISPLAMDVVEIPKVVPDPLIKITTYDTPEDFAKAIKGDKSVKPSSVQVISGEDSNASKEG